MRAVVIRIDAVGLTGRDLPLLLSSVDDSSVCHLNGEEWEPAINRLPRLRYDFFGGAFRGQVTAPDAAFQVSISGAREFFRRRYSRARVRIWQGEVGAGWPDYAIKFDGEIEGEPEIKNGIASFQASPDDEWLDDPFLDVFAGTGGVEGPDDLTGQVKPKVFGNARFAPGVLIDAVNVVYLVNDGPVESVNAVYDRAATLGASAGDFSDLAALLAADIAPGRWGTCHALGIVRLGAPPDGKIAFDVSGDNGGGYVRKPGEMIARIAEIAGGSVSEVSLAKLDAALPFNQVRSEAQQTTARQIIQEIADGIGATAGVSFLGELYAQPLVIDAGTDRMLASDGTSEHAVSQVSVESIGAPFWRIATNAEPTFVVFGQDEIATQYVLRGEYEADREYRLDDAVFTSDGRTFVYINDTPTSGNAPPAYPDTSNTYWRIEGVADNTAGSQINFAPVTEFSIQANAEGVTTTDLPVTRTIKLQRGGVDLASGVTYSIASATAGLTATIGSSDGVLSLSQASVSGEIKVNAVFGGSTYTQIVPVRRTKASPPIGGEAGSTSFTDTVLVNVNSATPVKVTDDGVLVQSDSSGRIEFTLFGQYQGDGEMELQPKYSTDNVTFLNAGPSQLGSEAVSDPNNTEIGNIGLSYTQTGLSADTDYYVALFANRTAGTGTLSWLDATFTAKQP